MSIYAAGLLYEGFISDRYASLLTYPFVDKPAAERAYDRLPAGAPAAQRAEAAQRLVEADPANPESWNAVAYADWVSHQGLSAAGVTALSHSYAVGFFDRPSAVWRVSFVVENWDAVTPAIRQSAMAEAKAALHDPRLGPELRARLSGFQDPNSKLAATLLLAMNPP